ncbi:MAG: ribbon-helix-helix protein, CopG family [Cyanobacteriota bacterium]|nr:ribbon-helix-helix protein, CopG family [Cyanobacteriota bacterium]
MGNNPAFEAVEVRPGVQGFISKSDRPVSRTTMTIRLYEDQMEAFDELCNSLGLSRSDYFRELVDRELKKSDRSE